ncbi:MAG: bifunctional oligoribonuclease/PAP phosphatase NrnA [Spirochaetales bacterium]|nr:bifunctional oligoribonuclease/PAP phosphatase NrnA [Spirochaetales bacterium]
MENSFDIIKKELPNYKKVVVIGHIQPDGDCVGSSLGMAYILRDNFGIEPIVVNQELKRFEFLGNWTLPNNVDYSDAFVIQVDNATRHRSADPDFINAPCILKIDHHLVVDSYGHYNVEKKKPSCCEIIAEDAINAGLTIGKEAARCLYAGMVTDTGRFAYPGVNSDTLRTAATMLDAEFDFGELMSQINKREMKNVKFIAYAYNQLQVTEKGVVWMYIPQSAIDSFGLSYDMVSEALITMQNISGHPVYVLFSDLYDKIRVEFRSDRVKLNHVAEHFGGGGHSFAAGARLNSADEISAVLEELDKLL